MQTSVSLSNDDQWVSLAEASRVTGRPLTAIKSAALAGVIRVDAVPGCRVRYRRDDLPKLKAEGRVLAIA